MTRSARTGLLMTVPLVLGTAGFLLGREARVQFLSRWLVRRAKDDLVEAVR